MTLQELVTFVQNLKVQVQQLATTMGNAIVNLWNKSVATFLLKTEQAVDSAKLEGKTLAEITTGIVATLTADMPALVASAINSNQTIQGLVAFAGTSIKRVFRHSFASPTDSLDVAALLNLLAAADSYTLLDGQYLITFDADGGTVTRTEGAVTTAFPITEGDMLLIDIQGGAVVRVAKHEDDKSTEIANIQAGLLDGTVLTPIDPVGDFNAIVATIGL